MTKISRIYFDSDFVEEAAFLTIKAKGDHEEWVKKFDRIREEIYNQDISGEEKDKLFKNFSEACFLELGLHHVFEKVYAEFPLFLNSNLEIFVKRIWNKNKEDSDLYVHGNLKRVVLTLQANRILSLASLEAFLRHQLMRISDILDSNFAYSPTVELGGKNEIEDNLIRDRFRILWDMYIDARLHRKNLSTIIPEEGRKKIFEKVFSFLPSVDQEGLYQKITKGSIYTQADLLKFACHERQTNVLDKGGVRCPLCDFVCYDLKKEWLKEDLFLIDEIQKDYPIWEPSIGLCVQCLDMYRSKMRVSHE